MKSFLLIAVVLLPAVFSENCPNPQDVPVMDERTNKYTGALVYQGPGHEFPFQACNGAKLTYVDEDRVSADEPDSFYDVGSLLVKAGCTFYGFPEPGYQGQGMPIRGPALHTQAPGFEFGVGRGFKSWVIDCDMSYVNCVPTDGYQVIFTCDGTGATVDTQCKYTKTIGTSYSNSLSESMNIDSTISVSIKAKLFGLFETTLGTSVSTGYNWGSVSTETMNTQQSFEVTTTAPAGSVVVIEQAVGHCDGSDVNTEMFRISHHTKDGQLIKTEYVKHGELIETKY